MAVDPRTIDRIYAKQQQRRVAVAAAPAAERIRKIRRLHDALLARRGEIRAAMWADYRKPAEEVDLSEIFPTVSEARHAMRNLEKWMRPRRVATPLALFGSRAQIRHEPKGVVLVIAPWNFPVLLTFGPLVSAIAAGNCVILKPSELTPNISACMRSIIEDLFEEDEVALIEGDATVAEELLRRKFDHVFFTGSTAIGKIVMKAAAEHLTPVTLELGGKSPVIVDRTADLNEAAAKIAWGKFLNCGQVCVAPDYALVDETVREPFIAALRIAINEGTSGILVNDRHAQRVQRLLDDAKQRGARVVIGGSAATGRDVAPTVLADVPLDSLMMREEIFGPLLPIVTYRDREEAVRIINERDPPLALYIFSRDKSVVHEILRSTRAGGTVINDTLIQFFHPNLPFGGVGASGMGKAHGIFGFETFSNARAIVDQPLRRSISLLIHPPYTWLKRRVIAFLLRWL